MYEGVKNKDMVRWYHKEMDAEEIRAYLGKCRFLVASRFHAMIGALEQRVPVLLVGWSHKYQEVLDFFELGQYAIDFSNLIADSLMQKRLRGRRDHPGKCGFRRNDHSLPVLPSAHRED